MKILHFCLSCFFIDGYGYQENYLPLFNQKDGHDVMIIASTETYVNGMLTYLKPKSYFTETGIPVLRLSYSRIFPHAVSKKIRHYIGLLDAIRNFSPDVMLFHGICAYDISIVADYKRNHQSVKLYVDSHTDYYGSARSFLSKNLLHRLFYKHWFQKARHVIDKVFYIGKNEKEYLTDIMGLTESEMEFFPLGGIIVDKKEKMHKREMIYNLHSLNDDTILFVHGGKLNQAKKTKELISAFSHVVDSRFRLFIIGTIAEEYKGIIQPLIEADDRIQFLGWKSKDELIDYLCAANMYLQPGSVSAILQNAICCGTPVMIFPDKEYELYVKENGMKASNEGDIIKVFEQLALNPEVLKDMSEVSYKMANELLDYKKLAARLYV